MHDAWLTGEIAVRRHMIAESPKCPLCKKFTYTKVHIILQCAWNKIKRENLLTNLNKRIPFKDTNLLYLEGNVTRTEIIRITEYIIDTLIACGPVRR